MKGETTAKAATVFSQLPISRQLGLLIGLAASIAIGFAVVLWSMEPSFRPLFSQLNSTDAAAVIDELHRAGIDYKINKRNGTVMVGSEDIHDARMKLAQAGLPRGSGSGFEIFKDSGGFGTSQFMETARYKHALENELARTVMQFNTVKAARVHLAIPKQSAFLRDKQKPTASVFIDVHPGVEVKSSTIASIVSLVASSIPGLTATQVTVVDQNGSLLSEGGGNSSLAMADRMLDYRQQVEENYANKIKELLVPIIGIGKVRTKVSADIDFTASEQTRESFNPDMAAVRSEQLFEEQSGSSKNSVGGPAGAVSNLPPANAELTPVGEQGANQSAEAKNTRDIRSQVTKNFELDKTISHTRQQPGRIRRLTVAVLVDNKTITDPKTKKVTFEPLKEEEVQSIQRLVANAIGFDSRRGDTIDVINTSFARPEAIEAPPEEPIWTQAWVWDVAKQTLAGLFVILLIFGVLRPTIRNLSNIPLPSPEEGTAAVGDGEEQLATPQKLEDRMAMLQNIANKDPKRVASVVKTWVDGS